MGLIVTQTFTNCKIEEIKIDSLPILIITDCHTNLENVKIIKNSYPTLKIICLGDITDLFKKTGNLNQNIIQYFIDNKIPCLKGNHEEHIVASINASNGDTLYQFRTPPKFDEHSSLFDEYKIEKEQYEYIKNFPTGFKLILSNGYNYLCFHNRPKDLWGFTEEKDLTDEQFERTYPIDNKTKGVLIGHMHRNFTVNHSKCERVCIGSLGLKGDYALLTNKGIEYKKI